MNRTHFYARLGGTMAGLALALALLACGGGDSSLADDASPPQSAEATVLREWDLIFTGQNGHVWDLLHPAQQAVVSRDQYIDCMAVFDISEPPPVQVLDSYKERVAVEGQEIATTAISYVIEGNIGPLGKPATVRDTDHLVQVGNSWRWILLPDAIAAFKAGNCPQ